MKIKDQTFRIRAVHFIMVVTGALIVLGGIRLINNNFDFNSIKVEAWDVVLLIFIGIASASGLKKIRIEGEKKSI